MPLIRLARDKRGLDTLYLLHPRSDRRGESRLRVLYFSAAPQGLTFGRQWLDVATQRALERQYPDITFDWPALLRELEQRRLPPVVEPQARRPRGPAKAERRAPSSDVPTDKAGSARRKRRRGSVGTGGPVLAAPASPRTEVQAGSGADAGPPPIIEP